MHKGNLILDSNNPRLNRFILHLPLHQEKEFKLFTSETNKEEIKISQKPKKITKSVRKEKPNLVLVEDNNELLEFITQEIQEDYHIFQAHEGRAALEIMKQENIQLVLSDVAMPGMDGYTLCKNIKTELEFSHIPVLLLTAKNALQSEIEGLECGADAYVTKPFSIDYLKAQINTLIKNRQHIIESFSNNPLSHIKNNVISKTDGNFLKKLDNTISENISNQNLNVETLAENLNISRSTLYRKIKEISNLSPNELINVIRLKKAAVYLATGNYRIFEVAEKVGYKSQTSFGRNFQKQFNMTPSEYINIQKT